MKKNVMQQAVINEKISIKNLSSNNMKGPKICFNSSIFEQ